MMEASMESSTAMMRSLSCDDFASAAERNGLEVELDLGMKVK